MLFEYVHPDHCFIELWIQRLNDFIVEMLLRIKMGVRSSTCSPCAHDISAEKSQNLPDTAGHQSL